MENMMNRFISLIFVIVIVGTVIADDWPQWRGPGRDGVWKETGIVSRFDSPQLAIRWRVPVSGGYSGPTVADNRVYLTDRLTKPLQKERIHCFDAMTGQNIWSREYECKYGKVGYPAGPRAAVTIGSSRAYALGAV